MASPKIQSHIAELMSWKCQQRLIAEMSTGNASKDEQIYSEAVTLYHAALDSGKSVELRSIVIALFIKAKL